MNTLTLVPVGGLANRFYSIVSAIAFCRDYNIKLKVLWFKDKGMGADFYSLFELSKDVDKSMVNIIDAKWYHYVYDRPRKRNLWLPRLWQFLFFDYTVYTKQIHDVNKPYVEYINNEGKTYALAWFYFYEKQNMYNYLKPLANIKQKINEISDKFNQNTIGVHIRRTDNALSIEKSPLNLFVEKMNEEIKLNSSAKFYVASDSLNDKKKLVDIFGERILVSKSILERSSEEGIVDALVELYSLSKTQKIYGSFGSTYSSLAAHISDIELSYCI